MTEKCAQCGDPEEDGHWLGMGKLINGAAEGETPIYVHGYCVNAYLGVAPDYRSPERRYEDELAEGDDDQV